MLSPLLSMSLPRPPEVLDERYRLLETIGSGAHGVVFRALDLDTDQEVAIKFLSDKLDDHSTFVERLRREALAMAELKGTAAVKIFALNQEGGRVYLVMEYLRGMDLASYLKQGEARGGQFKSDYLLHFLQPIVETLQVAHDKGIVHRDLKPSNIFKLDKALGGGVRLLDFGLVKMLDRSQITRQGQVAGTPSYIAPEAWRGRPETLDHRVDIYSLGVLVFRCLGGRVPHEYQGIADILNWALTGERPGLSTVRPDLPRAVDPWTLKSLAIDPAKRFQSVTEQWAALRAALDCE